MFWISDGRYYLDAKRKKVVPEGSPEAAYLLCVPGDELPEAEAKRLGLGKKAVKGPPEDKAVKPSENKAKG